MQAIALALVWFLIAAVCLTLIIFVLILFIGFLMWVYKEARKEADKEASRRG